MIITCSLQTSLNFFSPAVQQFETTNFLTDTVTSGRCMIFKIHLATVGGSLHLR